MAVDLPATLLRTLRRSKSTTDTHTHTHTNCAWSKILCAIRIEIKATLLSAHSKSKETRGQQQQPQDREIYFYFNFCCAHFFLPRPTSMRRALPATSRHTLHKSYNKLGWVRYFPFSFANVIGSSDSREKVAFAHIPFIQFTLFFWHLRLMAVIESHLVFVMSKNAISPQRFWIGNDTTACSRPSIHTHTHTHKAPSDTANKRRIQIAGSRTKWTGHTHTNT